MDRVESFKGRVVALRRPRPVRAGTLEMKFVHAALLAGWHVALPPLAPGFQRFVVAGPYNVFYFKNTFDTSSRPL